MNWAYLALAGRILLLGYERIAVKELGKSTSGRSASFMLFFTATIFFIPFLINVNWPDNPTVYFKIFLCAIIYSVTFTLYVKSLTDGEISLVGPLYNFNVFFLLFISVLFLGESFNLMKICGLVLMVYGASWLNKKGNILKSLKFLMIDRPCQLMIAFSLLLAIGRTMDKYLIKDIDPAVYGFVLYFQISLILMIYNVYKKQGSSMFLLIKEKPVMSFVAGAINTIAYLLLLYALKTIEVSIAEPANMLSMIISLFFAAVLYKENIKKRLLGVFFMMIGAWLLIMS